PPRAIQVPSMDPGRPGATEDVDRQDPALQAAREMSTHRIHFTLNGARREAEVPADRLLIDLVRDDCGATGKKLGCAVGFWRACSVLMDGAVVSACLIPGLFAAGTSL